MTRQASRICLWGSPEAILGALLIVIGGALLLDRLDLVHPMALLAKYWPASLVGAGVARLVHDVNQNSRV